MLRDVKVIEEKKNIFLSSSFLRHNHHFANEAIKQKGKIIPKKRKERKRENEFHRLRLYSERSGKKQKKTKKCPTQTPPPVLPKTKNYFIFLSSSPPTPPAALECRRVGWERERANCLFLSS